MKLISFNHQGRESYGAVHGDKVADFGKVAGAKAPDLKSAIAQNVLNALNDAAKPDIALSDVTLLLPITNPNKIHCVGLNYVMHVKETGMPAPKQPVMFIRFTDSHVAHNEALVCPEESYSFDYECELAVVIGKRGRRVSEADALSYVAGYTCYNDGSIRDWQMHTSQFTAGKNFPKTGAYGPWIVTADEIPDPAALTMKTRLNGKEVQSTPISDLLYGIPKLINYISTFTNIEPGDIIATGTPGGVGFTRKPPLWMKHGDTVEIEISSIGILRNPVIKEEK